jgi:predicted  nucleic acid-binding Zn-ribbon protein
LSARIESLEEELKRGRKQMQDLEESVNSTSQQCDSKTQTYKEKVKELEKKASSF